jgi:hypothetical protein
MRFGENEWWIRVIDVLTTAGIVIGALYLTGAITAAGAGVAYGIFDGTTTNISITRIISSIQIKESLYKGDFSLITAARPAH